MTGKTTVRGEFPLCPDDYQRLAARTECDQHASASRMIPGRQCVPEPCGNFTPAFNSVEYLVPVRVNHSLVGMAGEVGEIASLVQKWVYYGKFKSDADRAELVKQLALEYGDVLWYVALGLNALGLSMDSVMKANIDKLKVRYPDRYTDWHAAEENRDRAAEERLTALDDPTLGQKFLDAGLEEESEGGVD